MDIKIGIPRRLIDKFLRKMTPLIMEIVSLLKENADADGLTPGLKDWIKTYRVGSWSEAYENPANYFLALFSALTTLDDPHSFFSFPQTLNSPNEIQIWADSLWAECEAVLENDSDDDVAFLTEEPEPWNVMVNDDEGKTITRQGVFICAAFIICFNYFSCMVHRKSLFQLVAEARAGKVTSLLKAVQIDKRCIVDIPFVKRRVKKATEKGDVKFLRRLAQYRAKPIFQSGTTLNSLYLVFALLDGLGLLECYAKDTSRFVGLCRELEVYGSTDDSIDIVDNFERTLRRFRADFRFVDHPAKKILFVKDTN